MAGLPFHLPPKTRCDVQEFVGWASVDDVDWHVWRKPEGVSMVSIFMVGGGGGGGSGRIAANSVASGGGGGGSGGQSSITGPAFLFPDILYVTAGAAKTGAGVNSRVSIQPNATANHLVLSARGAGVGGNGGAGFGGSGGAGGIIASISQNPLSGGVGPHFLVGQIGSAGGSGGVGAAVTLPVTGLRCVGGAGGAGLGGAGSSGSNGGSYTVPAAPSRFPPLAGGSGTASATTPPSAGSSGFRSFMTGLHFGYGGTGGGSTHGSATGAGLVQAAGGHGVGYGCGGGGGGGALTGSTPAELSLGGPGYVLIISW